MAKSSNNGGGTKSGGGGGGKKNTNQGVTLTGTAGADTLAGGELNDVLYGLDGNYSLSGNGGNDYLVGGAGDDLLDGGTNHDQMDGGAGNDIYVVDHPSDLVIERVDGGTDTVLSSVNYSLSFDVENLTLVGGAFVGIGNQSDNVLTGNDIANRLDGGYGADRIDGGQGEDVLIGGGGADLFAFTTAPGAGNIDQILDFEAGIDRIALDDAIFAGLAPGALAAGAFAVGAVALEADDRILYDPATGALLFDADGAGGADAVMFASLQSNLTTLAATDFIVI